MKGSEQDAAPLGIAHPRHRRRVLPREEIEILEITCWVVRAEEGVVWKRCVEPFPDYIGIDFATMTTIYFLSWETRRQHHLTNFRPRHRM